LLVASAIGAASFRVELLGGSTATFFADLFRFGHPNIFVFFVCDAATFVDPSLLLLLLLRLLLLLLEQDLMLKLLL